jgi:hypothetical protein
MEFLDKNLISLILDQIGISKIINQCCLINKHWYTTIKTYYYQNKLKYLLYKKTQLFTRNPVPKLILSWHLVYSLKDKLNCVQIPKCLVCYKDITPIQSIWKCKKCKQIICKSCIRNCEICERIICTLCIKDYECCFNYL